jgi:hypothetical protein
MRANILSSRRFVVAIALHLLVGMRPQSFYRQVLVEEAS